MVKHVSLALLAAGTAMSVWAQQAPKVVGKFANVTGLVLVSTGDASVNAANGASFAVGNRVRALPSAGATLKFDNGCELTINANESVTVNENNQCKLAAFPAPVGSQMAGAVGGAGAGAATPAAAIVAGGVAAGVIIYQNNKKTSGS